MLARNVVARVSNQEKEKREKLARKRKESNHQVLGFV
jgi:hypothetical protein